MPRQPHPKLSDAQVDMVHRMTKKLADEGLLVGAGWYSFSELVMKDKIPDRIKSVMRVAFYAGAMHLFHSVMTMLDPEDEVTEADEQRMNAVSKELDAFGEELKALRTAQQSKGGTSH